jgi:hypothetical protein
MALVMEDIALLLASNRELLDAGEFEVERLQTWAAERGRIFCRLKQQTRTLTNADPSTVESLLKELLDLDAQIFSRIVETQRRFDEKIGTAKRIRKVFRQDVYCTPHLLQRRA